LSVRRSQSHHLQGPVDIANDVQQGLRISRHNPLDLDVL